MKKFIGYKIPKNQDYTKMETLKLDKVPSLVNLSSHYYFFYNIEINTWNIPQLCNNKDKRECQIIKEILVTLKKHDNKITSEDLSTLFHLAITANKLGNIRSKQLHGEKKPKKTVNIAIDNTHTKYFSGVWNSDWYKYKEPKKQVNIYEQLKLSGNFKIREGKTILSH